jgi:hypothetical protein
MTSAHTHTVRRLGTVHSTCRLLRCCCQAYMSMVPRLLVLTCMNPFISPGGWGRCSPLMQRCWHAQRSASPARRSCRLGRRCAGASPSAARTSRSTRSSWTTPRCTHQSRCCLTYRCVDSNAGASFQHPTALMGRHACSGKEVETQRAIVSDYTCQMLLVTGTWIGCRP